MSNQYYHEFTPCLQGNTWPLAIIIACVALFAIGLFQYKPGRRVPRMRFDERLLDTMLLVAALVSVALVVVESHAGLVQFIANSLSMDYAQAAFVGVLAIIALAVALVIVFGLVAAMGTMVSRKAAEKAIHERPINQLIESWQKTEENAPSETQTESSEQV